MSERVVWVSISTGINDFKGWFEADDDGKYALMPRPEFEQREETIASLRETIAKLEALLLVKRGA
jgi:hypothetical protein